MNDKDLRFIMPREFYCSTDGVYFHTCVFEQGFRLPCWYHVFCGLLLIQNKSSDDIILSVSISVDIVVTLNKLSYFCETYYE